MMKYSKLWKRCLAGLLCISMTAASLSGSMVTAHAKTAEESAALESAAPEAALAAEEPEAAEAEGTTEQPEVSEIPLETEKQAEQPEVSEVPFETEKRAEQPEASEVPFETEKQTEQPEVQENAEQPEQAAKPKKQSRALAADAAVEEITPLTLDESADVRITEQGGAKWFSFTPERSGRYCFESAGDYDTLACLYTDLQEEALEESDDISTSDANFSLEYALEAGVTYYYSAQMCYDYVTGFFEVSVSYVSKSVAEAVVVNPMRTTYYSRFDNSVSASGMVLDVTYTDGTTETVRSGYNSGEGYGIQLTHTVKSSHDSSIGRNVLVKGTYDAAVSYMDWEMETAITVADIEDAPVLGEDLAAEGTYGSGTYYQFQAPSTGYFLIVLSDEEQSGNPYSNIYTLNGTQLEVKYDSTINYINGKTVYLEQDTVYVVNVSHNRNFGYVYDKRYSLSIEASEDIEHANSNTDGTMAFYTFVPKEDGIYRFQIQSMDYSSRLAAYDTDWSSSVIRTSGTHSYMDEEGNVIYQNYYESKMLTAGQTVYILCMPYDSGEWQITVENVSTAELKLEEPVNGTLTEGSRSYLFRAPEEGSYHFKISSPASMYDIDVSVYDVTDYTWLEQSSNRYWLEGVSYYEMVANLSAGKVYLVRISSTEGNTSFSLSADKLPDLASLTVSKAPDKAEYVRTEQLDYTGLEVTASYADGTEEIIGYHGRGALTGQSFTVMANGLTDSNGQLRVGTHDIEVSYLGQQAEFTVAVRGETAEEIAAYQEMILDQEITETVPEHIYKRLQYRFTAPETGIYKLSNTFVQMNVYDSAWKQLSYYNTINSDMYVRYCCLEQGQTYVFESRPMSLYQGYTYTAKIEKTEFGVLGAEDTLTGKTEETDQTLYIGYIPEETGKYDFVLQTSGHSYAYTELYGKNGQISCDIWYPDEDEGEDSTYISADLEAGQIYLFRIYIEESGVAYSFQKEDVTSAPLDSVALESGGEYLVEIRKNNGCQWFSFTPEETATYCIYSTDYSGDPYVTLYSGGIESTNQVAYNDDGGDSYNFHLDYELKKGVTYYYKAHSYSGQTGQYKVHFYCLDQVVDMKIIKYPQQIYYTLPNESLSAYGLEVEVTLEDGTVQELTYGNYETAQSHQLLVDFPTVRDDDGNWIPGEYNVEVNYYGGKITYPITVIDVPATAEALIPGTPIDGSWDGTDRQIWSFTPSASGRYVFRSTQKYTGMGFRLYQGEQQLRAEMSGDWSTSEYNEESGESVYTYIREYIYTLEAGITYYLRGYLVNSDAGYFDAQCVYSVEAEKIQKYSLGTALEGITDASKRRYAEIDVQEEGFYYFESMVTGSSSSSDYMNLSFWDEAQSLSVRANNYERAVPTDGGRQYQYFYQYYVYLQPGTYVMCGRSSSGSENSYVISSERAEAWDIQNTVEDTMNDGFATFRGYEITAPATGAYTFTNRVIGSNYYYYNNLGLYNKENQSIGNSTYETSTENGTAVYTGIIGTDLTAGEKYLIIVGNGSNYYNRGQEYTLVGQFSPKIASAEFIQYPQQIYYYKVDQLTESTVLGAGSIVQLVYEDGKTETINYGSTSKYTGRTYTIEMPEDASYNSSGYLKIGQYKAKFQYLDYTQEVPVSVRSLSAMPAVQLDENGQGSYTGETENACGYGYVRFAGVADGFYNLTLSVERDNYISYEKVVNSAYKNMSTYSQTSAYTESRYLRNISVYVRQGQSCYVKYRKNTGSSQNGTGGEFTFSVERATDRDITELACNEQAEADITSTAVDQWYSFTPEETGYYLLNTQEAPYYTYLNLYASPDASSAISTYSNYRNGNDRYMRCSLTAGRTYYFRIYNTNRTGSFHLMLVKEAERAVSLELLTEGDIFCSSLPDYIANSFSDLEFLATYEDGTTEKLTFGYNGTSERYISLQGQRMSYTEPQWEYDENHEYILDKEYKVTFSYMDAALEVDVTARSIQDLDTVTGTVTAAIAAGKYEYYKFVPDETGYYRFDASAAGVYPELGMFDPYMKAIDSQYSNDYQTDGICHEVKVYRLAEGESYCLRLGNMSQGTVQVSCSNVKLSPAKSIEVSTYPQRTYYLGVDNQYSTDGLSIQATYEDGTTERVNAGGHSNMTGLALTAQLVGNEEGNLYFGTEGNKTIRISYMDVTTSYTVQVLKNEAVPEVTESKPYSGTLSDEKDFVYARVVAEESGYYQFLLSCEEDTVPYIDTVKNSSYTDMPSWKGMYYNDMASGGGRNTRMKLVYLLAGRTYFMKGRLTKGSGQTAGDYTVSIERISDLRNGVQTGTLSRYSTEVFQYTADRDGYYQFTLDAGEGAKAEIYNNSFQLVSTSEGSKNNRKYYVVKLKAGTSYMASCTNSGSTEMSYALHAAPKAEVSEIRIAKRPDKTLYYSQFETAVNTQGLAIDIVYADGTAETLEYGRRSSWGVEMKLNYSEVTRDEKGHFIVGTQTIGCEYLDQKTSFEIEVQNFDISMAGELALETMQAIDIPAGASAFYTFTPAAAGSYRFYSRGTEATFGYIYDSTGNMLYSNAAIAPNTNFSITANLTEGNTYILRVRAFSAQEAISTSIRLHDMAAFTEVMGVNVAPSEMVFGKIGDTRELQVSVLPEDAQNPAVTFYSSNTEVAAVSSAGLVTAVAEGSATVTVTTADGGYSADCLVIVDTTRPEITHVSPADNAMIGPTARTMWVYAHDNIGIAMLEAEYKRPTDASYTKHTLMEDGRTDPVILADIPLDGFADKEQVDVRLTAVDKGGNRSEAVTRTYTVDKNAPEIEGLAGVYNPKTLAVDLTWNGKMEQDISGYSVYRKDKNASDNTYTYLGFVTGYVNKADYGYSDASVPNENASYTYKVTANDKLGNSREYTVPVDVTRVNQAPEIRLSCAATMAADQEYDFELSASTDDGRIVSFDVNYGDGSEIQSGTLETRFKHTYTLPEHVKEKEVTVEVTATDNEGLAATETKVIRIVNLSDIGMLTVQVLDTDGIPLANAPVYFNMGEEDQVITNTDRTGKAEFTDLPGMYAVGVYISGYLPLKKSVELAVGETKTLTFTMEEKELVEGKFESHRMTLDEVKEAVDKGVIDLENDPTNYHVIRYEVTLEYTTMNIYYGDGAIVGISGGEPGYTYVPSFVSEEIVVILKIPVKVSILKEFYAVDLIIINNASEEFCLLDNHVSLNVPDGLTVMDGNGANGAEVDIEEIRGQTTETVSWVLRGDKSGEYYLSADFTGILSEFNVPVTSTFTSEDPIRVYGVDYLGVGMKIPDQFTNGEFYYSLTMTNTAEVGENAADMYLPGLDGAGELIQTMLMKEDGTKEYLSEMPEVLHAGESIERFYRITDQIYEQLQQYPDYKDFVFYFRRMWVEELTDYGVPLDIEVVPAAELAAVYERYRAVPAEVKSVSAQGAAYGYSRGDVKLMAEAAPASNAEYDLLYEWYDTHYDLVGAGAEFALPEGLAAGNYHYHCLVVSTRKDNGNKAQTQYQDVTLTITGRAAELVWSGDQNLVYNGTPVNVTAALSNVLEGDSCVVTVTGGNETNAGTYTARATALSNSNYSLPQETGHTYTIAPKTIGLIWSGMENRTYDGTASQVTAAAEGLVGEDICNVTVADGDRVHAGTYTALAAGLSNANYALPESVSQNYTIERAPLTAAYADETIYYGTTPVLAVNVDGFVGGETAETALQYTAPSISGSVPAEEGTYTLTPDGGAAADYTFTYTEGSLTIIRRDASEGADGQYTVTAPQGSNGWYTADLEIKPNTGYAIGDSEDAISGTGITLSQDTASGTRSFYIKNTQTGEIFHQSLISYKKDADAPEIGSFAAAPDNAGRQTVTFMVSDALSQIDPESITVTKDGSSVDVAAENGACRFTTAGAGIYTVSVKDLAGNTSNKELTVSALRFDSKGGSACEAMDLVQGAAYGTLPQTTRAGYEFAGWKDADGNDVSAETAAGSEDILLTAEWKKIPAKAPSVTADETEVQAVYGTGASLKITAVPDEDAQYALIYQWYLAENGTETAVDDGNTAELVIPASQAAGTYTYRCRVTARREDNQDTADADSEDITVTVVPKKVSVAFGNTETREYDGAASNVTAEVNGLVNGDICDVKVIGGSWKNAGIYKAEAALTFAEGKEGCYQVEGSTEVSYTITPKAAEIVWSGIGSRTYDGTASNAAAVVNGLVEGDTCDVSVTGGTEKNAGTYAAEAELAFAEGTEGNYTVSGERTAEYTITPKDVKLIWSGLEERTYDAKESNVTASISGLAEGDTCSVTVTGGTGKNAGTYTAEAELAFADGIAGNYKISGESTADYTILPKSASIVWKGTENRTYDGRESNVTASVSGLAEGDTCSVTVTEGNAKDSGSHTAKAALVFAEGTEGNYTVSGGHTAEYTIMPKEAVLTWSGLEERIYDGKASNVTASVSGLAEGDTCSVAVTGGTEKNAGTHTAEAEIVFAEGIEGNYTVSGTRTAEYTITPKAAELSWSGLEERAYDGTASHVTAVLAGLVDGDACEVKVTGGTGKDAGTYTAKAELAFADGVSGNYNVSGENTASYTITPKTAVIVWSGTASRVYDGTPSNVTASVSGLAEGDTCNLTVTGGNGVNAGTYTATAVSANSNYQLTSAMSVSYTIEKAGQAVTSNAQEYTGTAGEKVSISAAASGGGALSYVCSDSTLGTVSADGTVTLSKPGKMTVTITATATENYQAASCSVTVLALPKAVSVKKLTSPKAKQLKVTWKKDTSVSGYEIQYSLTGKFKKSSKKTWTATVNSKKASKTIKKLKAGKKYYVRIRAYKTIDGKKYYGAYGKVKKVKVKK